MQWSREKFTLKLLPLLSSGFSLLFACAFFSSTEIAAISSASYESPPISQLKCKNEQGKDVDWFIAYKLPKIRTSANPLVRGGLAYAYILPVEKNQGEMKDGNGLPTLGKLASKGSFSGGHGRDNATGNTSPSTWILSEKGIDSLESMVAQTVGKLFAKDNQDTAFLTYNDQPPVGPTTGSGGHTKGIIVTSLASGFWIQHSVPHFPLIGDNYRYPDTGKNNGQVFHCISLPSLRDVDNLGKILEITSPHVVNSSFPTDSLKNALPQLSAIVQHYDRTEGNLDLGKDNQIRKMNETTQESPCINEVDDRACLIEQLENGYIHRSNEALTKKNNSAVIEIRSAGGKLFHAFTKGPSFNEDIYSAWIAPNYQTRLEVQSWLNGPHPYPSNCTSESYSVYNIDTKQVAGQRFSTHSDHSKWAVSTNQPLVCISDLNRMEHQLKRGGVAVCFIDSAVWMTFNTSVIDIQPCPRLLSETVHPTIMASSASSSSSVPNTTQVTIAYGSKNDTKEIRASERKMRHRHRFRHQEVKSRTF